ncbi:hypothetical protein NMY22_g1256 [Coprinellus aureogranulatus]|nr:hypothetical protein NMY22_g1256 [Coprinellus aureogranulatus]
MNLFTANHVQLLNACYPPTSSLLSAGPAFAPSSHELSRLTYYASNHPGKLTKLGSELEKRIRVESKKAKAGNIRSRASLLISLAILRTLATECRSDIALLSPSLMSSVNVALASTPQDLEVVARLASVFTAWTTYTNGQLIGADQSFTEEYLSVLNSFADLASSDNADQEVKNRARLIGFAAVINALNSEALYNDSRQFRTQTFILLRPVLVSLFHTGTNTLDEQVTAVKENSGSGYLEEFRTRPAIERRAASIHVHIDGEAGPSNKDVSEAALRALFSLMSHANGTQLGLIMQSVFDNLDALNAWTDHRHCCWFALQIAEWSQYQYRYVVPTVLVDRLLQGQDTDIAKPLHTTLAAMVNAVFSSSIPMINLSSSDLLSKLLALLLRRSSISPADTLLEPTVKCISSLGCHVYYSDQIQDLAAEIINRLVMVEVQGITSSSNLAEIRSSSIRHLLGALGGLIKVANEHEHQNSKTGDLLRSSRISTLSHVPVFNGAELAARRTRIPPELWQDTLSLLCDSDERIRHDYATCLVYYLEKEMSKQGDSLEVGGVKKVNRLNGGFQAANVTVFLNAGDAGSRLLNSIHAYLYILVTNPSLALNGHQISDSSNDERPSESPTTSSPSRRSQSISRGVKAKKASLIRKMTATSLQNLHIPPGRREDYANAARILVKVQENFPIRGFLSGVPMLLQLHADLKTRSVDSDAAVGIRTAIREVWAAMARTWESQELLALCEQMDFDCRQALDLLASCAAVTEALGVPKEGIIARLSKPWDPQRVLHGVDVESSNTYDATVRGDNLSPLLKISPALMQIDNTSMHSLQSRPTRGLGVTDLREALGGARRHVQSQPRAAIVHRIDPGQGFDDDWWRRDGPPEPDALQEGKAGEPRRRERCFDKVGHREAERTRRDEPVEGVVPCSGEASPSVAHMRWQLDYLVILKHM